MDEYELLYKKSKEIYEETNVGGYNGLKHKKEVP